MTLSWSEINSSLVSLAVATIDREARGEIWILRKFFSYGSLELCRHWCHRWLSSWLPTVPPVTIITIPSCQWQTMVLSWAYTTCSGFDQPVTKYHLIVLWKSWFLHRQYIFITNILIYIYLVMYPIMVVSDFRTTLSNLYMLYTFECRYNAVHFFHDITYGTAMAVAELRWNFKFTTDTPYLALTGELWGVCCKDIGENWPHYNGSALYLVSLLSTTTILFSPCTAYLPGSEYVYRYETISTTALKALTNQIAGLKINTTVRMHIDGQRMVTIQVGSFLQYDLDIMRSKVTRSVT